MRIVKMLLSDVSISISTPFSSDLISTTPYSYISAPTKKKSVSEVDEAKGKDREELEKAAFGTYASNASGTQFTYRENNGHGSYRIITEHLDQEKSREELLLMRNQKKSDKFC
jgi:homogentisate 1,2-dioxygenase